MTGTILSAPDISRALTRIAHEILERNGGAGSLVLLGIPTRGLPLAYRLAERIADVEPSFDPSSRCGALDITMYRDDLYKQPTRTLGTTTLPSAGIDDAVVVLVDDVFHTGRTIRAALDAVKDEGRPRSVQLAVLVDRGHRELPIRADFVGKNIPTARSERVHVLLTETDGEDAVILSDRSPGSAATPGDASSEQATP